VISRSEPATSSRALPIWARAPDLKGVRAGAIPRPRRRRKLHRDHSDYSFGNDFVL